MKFHNFYQFECAGDSGRFGGECNLDFLLCQINDLYEPIRSFCKHPQGTIIVFVSKM